MDAAFIDGGVIAVTLIALAINVALLLMANRWPLPSWRWRVSIAVIAMVVYGTVFAGICQFGKRPLSDIRNRISFEEAASNYGYLPAWAAQWWYLDSDSVLADALAMRNEVSDRITPLEGPLPLPGSLVIIQAESLDDAVLGRVVDSEPVTPRLNALLRRSMRMRIRAVHENGSCDADFLLLHAHMPSANIANYRINGFPHGGALPFTAADAGVPMTLLHGYSGEFFNRRACYAQMGFRDLLFYDELTRRYDLPQGDNQIVQDRHVFDLSARLIRKSKQPTSHFIITMTSHTPFTFLPSEAPRPFDDPNMNFMARRYLNSVRYLDDCIGEFVSRLPIGTTVVIYADHESAVEYDGYVYDEDHEYVPLIVYRVGDDLAKQQKTVGDEIAMSGKLTMLDAANWIHRSVEAAAMNVSPPGIGIETERPVDPSTGERQDGE